MLQRNELGGPGLEPGGRAFQAGHAGSIPVTRSTRRSLDFQGNPTILASETTCSDYLSIALMTADRRLLLPRRFHAQRSAFSTLAISAPIGPIPTHDPSLSGAGPRLTLEVIDEAVSKREKANE